MRGFPAKWRLVVSNAEYLMSSEGQRRIRRFNTRGVSQANINATNLKSIAVPLPPLTEQDSLLRQLDAADSLITALDRQVSQTKYASGKELDRSEEDVLIVSDVRQALIDLNPDIAARPD